MIVPGIANRTWYCDLGTAHATLPPDRFATQRLKQHQEWSKVAMTTQDPGGAVEPTGTTPSAAPCRRSSRGLLRE